MILKELLQLVNGEIKVSPLSGFSQIDSIEIFGINTLKHASEKELSFFSNQKNYDEYKKTKAKVICVEKKFFKENFLDNNKIIILVNNIKETIKILLDEFYQDEIIEPKISSSAIISDKVYLGENVSIDDYTIIKQFSKIGNNTTIGALCYIGKNVVIGNNCKIYPMVKILDGTKISDNVIIHSGTVIGSDGFGYLKDKDGKHQKIKQVGIVEVSSNVEIGANVTIDRATMGKTFIAEGTKIDNLVHIAHNVEIGKNCLIIAQVGIAGSSKIGDNVILAGQAGIKDHVIIGDNSIVAAQAGVISDIDSGKVVSGYPAIDHKEQMKIIAIMNKLPKIYKNNK